MSDWTYPAVGKAPQHWAVSPGLLSVTGLTRDGKVATVEMVLTEAQMVRMARDLLNRADWPEAEGNS